MAFDAPLALALPLLVAGFASGVHCLGMCGGIVGAFAARRGAPPGAARAVTPEWPRQLAFNAGRIASYAAAGAIVGSLGGVGAWVAGALPAQTVLFVLANAMLVLVGLYLAGRRARSSGSKRSARRYGAGCSRSLPGCSPRPRCRSRSPPARSGAGCRAASSMARLRRRRSRAARVAARW